MVTLRAQPLLGAGRKVGGARMMVVAAIAIALAGIIAVTTMVGSGPSVLVAQTATAGQGARPTQLHMWDAGRVQGLNYHLRRAEKKADMQQEVRAPLMIGLSLSSLLSPSARSVTECRVTPTPPPSPCSEVIWSLQTSDPAPLSCPSPAVEHSVGHAQHLWRTQRSYARAAPREPRYPPHGGETDGITPARCSNRHILA
jgi:hypothetical protein